MIENRRGLDIFCHIMLIIGVLLILFPLYVAFVAASLDDSQVFQAPMTLIPGPHLWQNISHIWHAGVGNNSTPFGLMLLNSFVMALPLLSAKSLSQYCLLMPSFTSVSHCGICFSG